MPDGSSLVETYHGGMQRNAGGLAKGVAEAVLMLPAEKLESRPDVLDASEHGLPSSRREGHVGRVSPASQMNR